MGTVGGVFASIELVQQTVDLGLGKGLVGPDRAVAGHDHAAFRQLLRQAG